MKKGEKYTTAFRIPILYRTLEFALAAVSKAFGIFDAQIAAALGAARHTSERDAVGDAISQLRLGAWITGFSVCAWVRANDESDSRGV